MKDDLSQNTHGNMMFSVCSVKMVFLFPTNMKFLLRYFPENRPKDGISSITEKDDAYSRKDYVGILD